MPILTIEMSQDAADRIALALLNASNGEDTPPTAKQYVISDLRQLVHRDERSEAYKVFTPDPIDLT